MKKRIFIQGSLVSVSLLLSGLLSKYLFADWKSASLDVLFDLLGVVAVLIGFLFRISARGYKAEYSKDGGSFIFGGPYKLTRNPMYFGTLLIGLGVIAVLFQWWVAVIFLAFYLAIYLPQIKKEEDFLEKRFGQEYKLYCRQTHRYFPGIKFLFNDKLRECLLFRWSWVKKERTSLIVCLVILYVIEAWKDISKFGYNQYLREAIGILFSIIGVSFIIILIFHAEKFPGKLQNNFKLQAKQ